MKPLTERDIRDSFVNASPTELERMTLPGLHEVLWNEREYLGWRDAQSPLRGYVVHWVDDRAVGIVVRASESGLRPGIPAMCALCHTQQPSPQVRMFTAPRAGEPGRNGNSLGTYICDDLACSLLIRMSYVDGRAALEARAAGLLERVQSFTANVMRSA
jgi:hypothetical protein